MNSKSIRFHLVLLLIIVSNIIGCIYPKGMGFEVNVEDIGYQFTKYTYGLCIVIMLPALIAKIRMFDYMRMMVFFIFLHFITAYAFGMSFVIGNALKNIMICLSFVFFEETVSHIKLNRYVVSAYILSIICNITILVLYQNRLETIIEEEYLSGGQGISISMIYVLPLIFLMFRQRVSVILFFIGFFVIFMSMRRTAMVAYVICVPFVYRRISTAMNKKLLYMFFATFIFIVYYVVTHYWYVIELRFLNAFEADKYGNYGSGRTGWWSVLLYVFLHSPLHWIQGFGLGQVASTMDKAGFPFGVAHNDYLEIGFTYGVVGLFLWFATFIKAYSYSLKRRYKDVSSLVKMIVIAYLVIALFSGATHQPHFMSVALFFNMIFARNNVKST